MREITDPAERARVFELIEADPPLDPLRLTHVQDDDRNCYLAWWIDGFTLYVHRVFGRGGLLRDNCRVMAEIARTIGCTWMCGHTEAVGRIIARRWGGKPMPWISPIMWGVEVADVR